MEVLFSTFFVFLVSGLVLSLVAHFHRKRRRRIDQSLQQLAEERGGTTTPAKIFDPARLQFTLQGCDVQVEYEHTGDEHTPRHTNIYIQLPITLPDLKVSPQNMSSSAARLLGVQDIEIGVADFDPRYVIKGAGSELLDDAVRGRLDELRAIDQTNDVVVKLSPNEQGTELLIQKGGWLEHDKPLRRYISSAEALLMELQESRLRPWAAVAAATGLTLTEEAGLPQLTGQIHGCPVSIRIVRDGKRWRTVITAQTAGPAGLHIVHKDHTSGGRPLSIPNPVLSMTVSVFGDDPEVIKEFLSDESRTSALLPVVHGHPGSTVTEDTITLQAQGWLLNDLPEVVEKVTALLAAMSTRSACEDRSQQRAARTKERATT